MGELITVYGGTDGTSTTGVFTLRSEAFTNTPTYIKGDKGLKIKIWARRVSGAPATIYVEYIPDTTVSTPTPIVLDAITLASTGQIELEKRKPIIVTCRTGKEGIRFSWSQSTAGITSISFDIEFEELHEQ